MSDFATHQHEYGQGVSCIYCGNDRKHPDLRPIACTHCNGSRRNVSDTDRCPWCDGFGTASMEARMDDALRAIANVGLQPDPEDV